MLLVDARVGVSQIQGLGLIAHEWIPKGTCIWILQPGFDLFLSEAQMQALPAAVQRQARRYAYFDPAYSAYILASDDSRFCNHADNPNTVDEGDAIYAACDICPGEEITWDYRPWPGTDF